MFLILCYHLKINLNEKKYICTFFWEKELENYINSDDVHYLGWKTTQDREMLFS